MNVMHLLGKLEKILVVGEVMNLGVIDILEAVLEDSVSNGHFGG